MKVVGQELGGREPDEAAALRLVAAYEAHEAEPWLTAFLLGCVGHEVGYQTVRDILMAGPRKLAESYAGPALAKIRGPRAQDDLVELTNGAAPTRRGREGAGYGLAHLGTEDAAVALLDAAIGKAIGYQMAGSALAKLPLEPRRVGDLLDRGDEQSVRIAVELLCTLLVTDPQERLEANRALWLAPVQRTLANPDFRMAPYQREALTGWVTGA